MYALDNSKLFKPVYSNLNSIVFFVLISINAKNGESYYFPQIIFEL